jgi:hypothetical protein
MRCEREYTELQRELARAQQESDERRINDLLERKGALLQRIAGLKFSDA